jgi:hypothetical protein
MEVSMRAFIAGFVVLLGLAGSARADFIDPADLHVTSDGSFSQSAGGTDWTTLPTFNGTFTVQDVSNNSVNISPWHIVFAIPNQTGALADLITKIGTTDVNISPGPEVILTSGSAYDALGLPNGTPGSLSFTNFNIAEAALGLPVPTSYGLNDFTIAGLLLLAKSPLDIQLQGFLPAGTIIFAYGVDGDTLYTTAFTNAGVITPRSNDVPEPGSMALLVTGLGSVLGIGWFKRRKAA